jgi:hypothetical protein
MMQASWIFLHLYQLLRRKGVLNILGAIDFSLVVATTNRFGSERQNISESISESTESQYSQHVIKVPTLQIFQSEHNF